MKTLIRFFCVPLLSVVMLSCNDSHFLKDPSYREQVMKDFEQKQKDLPYGDLSAIVDKEGLTSAEREALIFLYAYMPIGDITDYSGEYYLENIRQSEQTRKEMTWGKEVSDELYRHFVLPIRVNNENLDDSRKVFYAELKERVKGLSMKDAILEVNHWCHEKVVYRPSDARTSSPLASVKTAYGRCGEESTFAVAALRSVGIPARQVYTPRWAHTDDNHAWVEAWADGKWYFLGACEPEPVLNLGWFNAPASRGMLMHTKVFGRYTGTEEVMSETPNYTEINVTANYAPTAKATVTVKNEGGQPVAHARVEFKVYNYAEFYTVATKYTDADGKVSMSAGLGDMLVWASADNGRFGFAKLSFGKQQELVLALDKKEGDVFDVDIDIVPPVENAQLPEVTPEQRAENDRRMAQEDSIRNTYVATFPTSEQTDSILADIKAVEWEKLDKRIKNSLWHLQVSSLVEKARGNHAVICRFLQEAYKQGKLYKGLALLHQLSEKDLRDVSYEVLADHFMHTEDAHDPVYRCCIPMKLCADVPLHETTDILNPRIDNEMLNSYRAFFQSQFSKDEAEAFRKNPESLAEWTGKYIKVDNTYNSQAIPISPEGVWRARVADSHSRDIFFVALARSLGIPARIRPMDGQVGYFVAPSEVVLGGERAFKIVRFDGEEQPQPARTPFRFYVDEKPLLNPYDNRVKYYDKYTLSEIADGQAKLLNSDNNEFRNDGYLYGGYYLLTTGTRLANGGVLAHLSSFVVPHKEATDCYDIWRSSNVNGTHDYVSEPGALRIPFTLRPSGEKVAVIGNFNSESLFRRMDTGETQSLLQACGRGYFVVGVLGVGQEPTNHALKDIAAMSAELEKWGRKLVLLFPDEAQSRKFRPEEFPGLPSTVIYGIDTDHSIQQQIVEGMELKHKESLPLFIIADTFNRVVFVSQGYTIGLGEQLMKVVRGL